jgi:hypothetical protein
MQHETQCECYYCKYGHEASKKKEREGIIQYGFYIHAVKDDCKCPHHINFHTHGLKEVFGHLDLQICFPLQVEIAYPIFHGMVDEIRAGKIFEAGKKYSSILVNYNVELIEAIECGRPVLRLLLPNKQGTLAGMEYGLQRTMLNND